MSKKKELKAEIEYLNRQLESCRAGLKMSKGLLSFFKDVAKKATADNLDSQELLYDIYKYGPRNVSEQFKLNEMFVYDEPNE